MVKKSGLKIPKITFLLNWTKLFRGNSIKECYKSHCVILGHYDMDCMGSYLNWLTWINPVLLLGDYESDSNIGIAGHLTVWFDYDFFRGLQSVGKWISDLIAF